MKSKTLVRQPRGVIVDLEPLYSYNRALAGDVLWKMRDRRYIAVKAMETSHLRNVINMLDNRSPVGTVYRCDDLTRRNWMEIMQLELERRGESLHPVETHGNHGAH